MNKAKEKKGKSEQHCYGRKLKFRRFKHWSKSNQQFGGATTFWRLKIVDLA